MYSKTINVYDEVNVEVCHEFDMEDILDLVSKCNEEEKEKILKVINETPEKSKKIRRKDLCFDEYVSVDFDYDVNFDQIRDLVCECSMDEKEIIVEDIGIDDDNFFMVDNLYDEQKVKLLKEAFCKYNLEELEARLK